MFLTLRVIIDAAGLHRRCCKVFGLRERYVYNDYMFNLLHFISASNDDWQRQINTHTLPLIGMSLNANDNESIKKHYSEETKSQGFKS